MKGMRVKPYGIAGLVLLCCLVGGESFGASLAESFYNDPFHVVLTPGDDSWYAYEKKTALKNQECLKAPIGTRRGPTFSICL